MSCECTSSGAGGGTVVHKVVDSAWCSCEVGVEACAATIEVVCEPAGLIIP